jgi:hypothetical protein
MMWSSTLVLLFLRSVLFLAAFLLAVAYALRRGGGPERAAAAIMSGGLLLSLADLSIVANRFHGPEYGLAFVDVLMLVAFIWLALTADRFWTLWVAALQAVTVLSHFAMILKPVPLPAYYKNTIQLWSYPQVALLAVGTLRHRLRGKDATRIECWLGRMGTFLVRAFTHERGAP